MYCVCYSTPYCTYVHPLAHTSSYTAERVVTHTSCIPVYRIYSISQIQHPCPEIHSTIDSHRRIRFRSLTRLSRLTQIYTVSERSVITSHTLAWCGLRVRVDATVELERGGAVQLQGPGCNRRGRAQIGQGPRAQPQAAGARGHVSRCESRDTRGPR